VGERGLIYYLFDIGVQSILEDEINTYRAGGDCICEICKKRYSEHSLDKEILDFKGDPFLNILCNGDRVKL
jgi:hypothetical protein